MSLVFTPEIMQCIHQSAQRYQLPEALIVAVIKTEGGENGVINHNHNGTVDIGIMQVNSIHLPELKKNRITLNTLRYRACTNIEVGTWILRKGFGKWVDYRDAGQWWKAVGNYHSRTHRFNISYQKQVWSNLNRYKHRAQLLRKPSCGY